jgi:uncharacterized protein YbaR (Trm112 family)
MKYELLDILACPIDKHYPLELLVIEQKWEETKNKRGDVVRWIEIETGVLFCEKCNRWYPIVDEIPILYPDELRRKEDDLKFLENHKKSLPEKIVKDGKPFSLSSP